MSNNKQNKFRIIIASYNNENWVEYNLASLVNQTYQNYHAWYVDDCSTDNTSQLVHSMVGDNKNFTIIRNDKNYGSDGAAIYNYVRFFEDLEDDDICVFMCGDDWLSDENVLENLNNYYNQNDVWMSYGKFFVYDGSDVLAEANPQNTKYPDIIHDHKLYRRDTFRSSHLLTFRGFLLKALDTNDIKSNIDGKWYYHAPDLAITYPCMEMCPKDKIGVVDFPTYVWNGSQECQVRTKHRQSVDNHKYELEIRNKKRYKEGLSGEKLPQINVYCGYLEGTNIPSKFTYCYNQEDGEYDMVFIGEGEIYRYVAGEIKVKPGVPVVARLFEHKAYFDNKLYDFVLQHYNKFDVIFTHDKDLLEKLPNAKFMPAADVIVLNRLPFVHFDPRLTPQSWEVPFKSAPDAKNYELPEFKIYDKSKLVSVMASDKAWLPGHVRRLELLESVKNKVDVFGTCQKVLFGRQTNFDKKFLSLRDYAFSIAIENLSSQVDDYYFTEKIVDCFITGTVPIYHGCPNIGKFFDLNGIITFDTEAELNDILDNLTMDKYYSMVDAIKHNYEVSMTLNLTNDNCYEYYYKDILKKHNSDNK